jgi:ABC-type polar amino acid transport system ATPase subunit
MRWRLGASLLTVLTATIAVATAVLGPLYLRAAVARTLAIEPDLILADEPTSALDDHWSQIVLEQLVAHARRGAAVIVASGDTEVTSVCDRVLKVTSVCDRLLKVTSVCDRVLTLAPAAPPAGTAAS